MGCADSKEHALVKTISIEDEKVNRETTQIESENLQLEEEIEAQQTFLHNESSPLQIEIEENEHFSNQESLLESEKNSQLGSFSEVLSLGERPFERQIYKQQGENELFLG
jgi:hypothetical protein